MEHKIGEIFERNGVTLRVEKAQGWLCTGCFFYYEGFYNPAFSCSGVEACGRAWRKDGENVIFRLIKED